MSMIKKALMASAAATMLVGAGSVAAGAAGAIPASAGPSCTGNTVCATILGTGLPAYYSMGAQFAVPTGQSGCIGGEFSLEGTRDGYWTNACANSTDNYEYTFVTPSYIYLTTSGWGCFYYWHVSGYNPGGYDSVCFAIS